MGDTTDTTTATDENGAGDSTTDNTKTGDTGAQSGTNTSTTTETDASVTKADFDALFAKMQNADRRATKAETELRKKADADLSEVDRIKKEAEDARAETVALKAGMREAKIYNAFLADGSVSWYDNVDAFTLLAAQFMDSVDVDDQGKVTGMGAAIKAMAKKKPHLVKTGTTEATGDTHNGKRKGADTEDKAEQAARRSRFPAAFNNFG